MLYSKNEVADIKSAARRIETYNKKIAKNNERIAQIEEEFRIKCENKKASLVAENKKIYDENVAFWDNIFKDRFGKTIAELMVDITSEEEPSMYVEDKTNGDLKPNVEAVNVAEPEKEELVHDVAEPDELNETDVAAPEEEVTEEEQAEVEEPEAVEEDMENEFEEEEEQEEPGMEEAEISELPDDNEGFPDDFDTDDWA